jgi:hypothetical protein
MTWEDEHAAICFFETDNWPLAYVFGGRAEGTIPHREAPPGKIGKMASGAKSYRTEPWRFGRSHSLACASG